MIPQMALTPANEIWLRAVLFTEWEVYYAGRRYKTLSQLHQMSDTDPRRADLLACRFYEHPAPTDLSGACKISAQVAHTVFNLAGAVVSNPAHTFVLLDNGELYDLNRDCEDVSSYRVPDYVVTPTDPYAFEPGFSASPEAVRGRASWQQYIRTFYRRNAAALRARAVAHRRPVFQLPDWCKIRGEPRRHFVRWTLETTELM